MKMNNKTKEQDFHNSFVKNIINYDSLKDIFIKINKSSFIGRLISIDNIYEVTQSLDEKESKSHICYFSSKDKKELISGCFWVFIHKNKIDCMLFDKISFSFIQNNIKILRNLDIAYSSQKCFYVLDEKKFVKTNSDEKPNDIFVKTLKNNIKPKFKDEIEFEEFNCWNFVSENKKDILYVFENKISGWIHFLTGIKVDPSLIEIN